MLLDWDEPNLYYLSLGMRCRKLGSVVGASKGDVITNTVLPHRYLHLIKPYGSVGRRLDPTHHTMKTVNSARLNEYE